MRDLTTKEVEKLAKAHGVHRVSRGLYLQVDGGSRSWLHRYMLNGRAVAMGLGPIDLVPLADARNLVIDHRRLLLQGVCPLGKRRAERPVVREKFEEVARQYHETHSKGWTNARYVNQWLTQLEQHVFPNLGATPINQITPELVRDAFRPIWPAYSGATHPLSSAKQFLERCGDVWFYAKPLRWVTGENPFAWEGNMKALLGTYTIKKKHHPSLPWRELPAFMADLRAYEVLSARALEFCILTGVRTDECLEAQWGEIDFDTAVWTIPAMKMKNGDEHMVPLSPAALAVLRGLGSNRNPDDYVFTRYSQRMNETAMWECLSTFRRTVIENGKARNVTVHGFRASLRGYALANGHLEIVAEMALAHRQKTEVLAAYTRDHDLFAERTILMNEWADHCGSALWPNCSTA
jgi:integrase